MPAVKTAHAVVRSPPDGCPRKHIPNTPDQMAQRVTAESITAEQNNIYGQYDRADADAERGLSGERVCKPEGLHDIARKYDEEEQCEIEKVPVYVLNDEGKRIFAPI